MRRNQQSVPDVEYIVTVSHTTTTDNTVGYVMLDYPAEHVDTIITSRNEFVSTRQTLYCDIVVYVQLSNV